MLAPSITTSETLARAAAGTFGTLFCAGLCLVAAAAPAAPASAETASVVRTEQVRYGDLDLASADGRATLDHRIRAASRRVCASDAVTLASRSAVNRCVDNAIGGARAQLSDTVTASN